MNLITWRDENQIAGNPQLCSSMILDNYNFQTFLNNLENPISVEQNYFQWVAYNLKIPSRVGSTSRKSSDTDTTDIDTSVHP